MCCILSLHRLSVLLVLLTISVFSPAQPVGVDASAATGQTQLPEPSGDLMMLQHRYQAALEAYRQVQHPTAELWNKMGIANQLMTNLPEAARCYQVSLRLHPNDAHVLNNLGTVYDAAPDHKRAEKMYRKALKLAPQSALIYKNLGTAQLANHEYEKGWKNYQTALALDPEIFSNNKGLRVENPATTEQRGAVNYYMAKTCAKAGMYEPAIDYLRKALNEGFTSAKKVAEDQEFAGLRGLPEFQKLLEAQNRP